MNGVDSSDQMLSNHNVRQKCYRWWKVLFFHLIDRVSYFFCSRSSAEFTVNDAVNLLDFSDDLDTTILSGSEDERLNLDNSQSDVGSSNVSNEEIIWSNGSDDEASNQKNPNDEESKDTYDANNKSTSDEKSSNDNCYSKSPVTKKSKIKGKKDK